MVFAFRGVFRTQSNIYKEGFLRKQSLIIFAKRLHSIEDIWLAPKNSSDVNHTQYKDSQDKKVLSSQYILSYGLNTGIYETKYSRMNLVKFAEDNLLKQTISLQLF